MDKIARHRLKAANKGRDEVHIDSISFIRKLESVISPNGGVYTMLRWRRTSMRWPLLEGTGRAAQSTIPSGEPWNFRRQSEKEDLYMPSSASVHRPGS